MDARHEDLLARARAGDPRALAELFDAQRERLTRMVALRLDPRLRRRVDPADVVQEAWIEVARRFGEWAAADKVPFPVWLRLSTAQCLAQAQRRHLGAGVRDAQREAALQGRASISSANVADAFVDSATSPTHAARRDEVRTRVLAALEGLDEIDREIVVLRHFEGLSNAEAAAELGLEEAAASKRFLRALVRLRPALEPLAREAGGSP